MPRLLNSAVQLKGTTGTNSYFITLSEAQPNLGTTPTTSTGYTLVTQGPLKQLVFTNTLGDIAFTDGVAYRNTVDGDLTLTSTGSGKLNLLGNVYLSGQELSANTGTFNFLYATTGSITSLTSTNITATIVDVTSGTIDRLFANTATIEYLLADTATIFESFSAFGTVTLSPINYSVSISPGGSGAVYINPSSMGLIDNMTIGLSVPRNGYFTNLTADTLTLTEPVSISTGTFETLITDDLQVNNNATVTNSLYAGSLYDNGNRVITQVTVSAGTGLLGGGTITGTSGTVTLTNAGVLTLSAGTDTKVSTSTGNVTIWNDSTLQTVTDRGATTSNSIEITNTTRSTSTDSGSLVVSGGVGVGGDVYSASGSPYYNQLLYTPKVTVDTVPPSDPRIGDFWIDPSVGVEYQLVPNGTSTIWVQFIGF